MAKAESKRLAVVFGTGLAIGLVAAGAYFFVVQPRHDRAEAAKQIAAWETRWTAATECLYGPQRRAAAPSDAIAIARLDADQLGERECGVRVGKLSRPEGPDTGMPEVERAWNALEAAAVTLAKTYGTHVGAFGGEQSRMVAPADAFDALGTAAATVETAHAALRRAAGLAERPAAAAPAITDVAMGPAVALGAPIRGAASFHADGGVAAIRLVGDDVAFDVVARGPREAVVRRIAPDSARAYPDGGWAAVVEDDDRGRRQVLAGPVGDDGEVGAGAVRVAVDEGASATVLGALGAGAERLIIGDDPVQLYRSRDGGKTWTPTAIRDAEIGGVARADAAAGAIDLFWSIRGGARWVRLTGAAPGDLPEPVTFTSTIAATCGAGDVRWYTDGNGVVRVGGGRSEALALAGANAVVACGPDAALAAAPGGLHRCGGGRCAPVLEGFDGTRGVAALDGAAAAFAAPSGRVIAVWRVGKPATFVREPDGAFLVGAVYWGGQLHLALIDATGLRFAAVP